MDPVRTSHIRQFANAVSLTLQGHSSRSDLNQQHLRGLLDVLARSNMVGQFITSPGQADQHSHWKPSSLVVVNPSSAALPEQVRPKPVATADFAATNVPASVIDVAHGSTNKKQVKTAPTPAFDRMAAPSSLQINTRAQLAGRFFVSLPWAGRAPAVQADVPLPLPIAIPKPRTAVLASHFFAALPWSSQALAQSISIGSGSDDMDKARRLGILTGRSESVSLVMPAYLKAPSDPGAATTAAFGFFSKLPWGGKHAVH